MTGDVNDHVTNLFAICHFLLVSHWNRGYIFNRLRDIRPQIQCARTHTLQVILYSVSRALYCIGQTKIRTKTRKLCYR